MNFFNKAFAVGHSQKTGKLGEKHTGPVKAIRNKEEDVSESVNSSITSECRPNSSINDSISFKNLFFSEGRVGADKNLVKPAQKIIKLKEKLGSLTEELQTANEEIARLKEKIEENQKKHASQLQNMQEKHEIKLTKTKKDIDFLLNDLNSKSTAILAQTFLQKHSQEMDSVHRYYENAISNLKLDYEKQKKLQTYEKNRVLRILKAKIEKFCLAKKSVIEKSGPVAEIFEILKNFEDFDKENDSFEEMSTLESEQGAEKKSASMSKLRKQSNFF